MAQKLSIGNINDETAQLVLNEVEHKLKLIV